MYYKLILLNLTLLAVISCKETTKTSENINYNELTEEEIIRQVISIDPMNVPLYSDPCGVERKAIETGRTNWLIIKNSSYANFSKKYQPNEIILITNKKEIIKMEKLFFNNDHPVVYPCGYEYQILFWTKPNRLLLDEVYNSECHSYCFDQKQIEDAMAKYIMRLKVKPTHYLYNFKIDVKIPPRAVLRAFADSNVLLFFITTKGELEQREKTSLFYHVQLADESPDINVVRHKFKKYKIITEITEVTE